MAFTKNEIERIYSKRAKNYDVSANLYYLLGFREVRYRKRAVASLCLKPGDAVVELGCGTGLNFDFLQDAIGHAGTITGIDLSDAMLAEAESRIRRNGWRNVRLIHTDAAGYTFPENVAGVISTFAITLVPEYESIIERASEALDNHGRLVILDLKDPGNLPQWVLGLAVSLTRPFGVTLDLKKRKPWTAMEKHFSRVSVEQVFGGFAFIATGENV